MSPINRAIEPKILETLKSFPAVYINGPRQAGKTTLVKELLFDSFRANYISFDDALERAAALRNPYNYLKDSGSPLIIDEVQLVKDLFRPLKKLIDEQRNLAIHNNTSANGKYLLTGSANLMAIPQMADAMVGRMATLTLLPLSTGEVNNMTPSLLTRCFTKDFSGIADSNISLQDAISQSSFPELLNMPKEMSNSWFRNYVQQITMEDPRHIYNLEKAENMPILLQALAARAGSLVNDASIGREIGLNAVTTRNYRSLLNNTFITHTLSPWYRNITKRLVKSPKIYFYDTKLLCYLSGTDPLNMAKSQPHRFGHILENFVLSELMKANHATGDNINISFYHTDDGREIDFILEQQNKLVAIEVKHAENITEKHLSGIKELQKATGRDFVCGIVLCNTPRVITFDKDIYLLPISSLWQ